MKLIFTLAIVVEGVAGFAQIPNPSFENWNSFGSYENPCGWYTQNATFEASNDQLVQSTTSTFQGARAVKLENLQSSDGSIVRAMMISGSSDINQSPGFAYALRPSALKGYFRFLPAAD